MSAAIQERLAFAPPPTPGLVRSMVLALLAHGVLVAMLTLGVQWKREATPVTVEAELWSALPVQAAAPAPEETAPPEPPKPPPPEPKPEPKPEPVVAPKPVQQPNPAIALAREKEKAKLLKEKQLQQLQLEKEKLVKDKLAKEKLALKEKELLAKAAKDKAAKREAEEAKAMEADRQKNLKRMAGLAGPGGSGEAGSTSTALQSSGPSAGYTGRIQARIKPNVTYTEIISGNPVTEIEVSLSPTGDILSRRIVKGSGNKSWDNAALNAIDKTEKLPLDNGKNWSPLTLVLSPKTLLNP
jgi:colicin import membrane protein